MSKKIAYLIIDNGVDGMEKDKIMFASWDEAETKKHYDEDKNKAYRTLDEKIVDVGQAYKNALSKLNGLDRLVLDFLLDEYTQPK